jgi:hypothetical protein
MSSASKGHSFEREVAVILSKWMTNNERDDIFYRSQSSGARATQRNKSGKKTEGQHGDIAAACSQGEPLMNLWNIEVKTGYATKSKLKDGTNKIVNWDVLDLLDSKQKTPTLWQMWFQCTIDASLSKRQPILIFRRNLRSVCIIITLNYFLSLMKYFGYTKLSKIEVMIPDMYEPNNKIIIMRFDDFLSWVNAKSIIDLGIK